MIHIKVYVVTSGCYSDYSIERVFLDADVAERYSKMVRDGNDVLVFDTDDDLIRDSKHIVIQDAWLECRYGKDGNIYCEEPHFTTNNYCDVDIKKFKEQYCYDDAAFSNATSLRKRYKSNYSFFRDEIEREEIGYSIYIKRVYRVENEKNEAQLSKILHDIDAIVRAKLAEGFSIDDIAKLFEHYDAEGEVNENV